MSAGIQNATEEAAATRKMPLAGKDRVRRRQSSRPAYTSVRDKVQPAAARLGALQSDPNYCPVISSGELGERACPVCASVVSAAMELVSAITAAAVALVVAILTPAMSSLRQRRDAVHAKFDNAVAAILRVQAARHIPSNIDHHYYPGDVTQHRAFVISVVEASINRFVEETTAARAALADIASYVPEIGDWIQSEWELSEENAQDQRRAIEARRSSAVRSVRLFQSRRPISDEMV